MPGAWGPLGANSGGGVRLGVYGVAASGWGAVEVLGGGPDCGAGFGGRKGLRRSLRCCRGQRMGRVPGAEGGLWRRRLRAG